MNEDKPMKAHDKIIVALLLLLLIFGVLSFFAIPKYEEGAKLIVGAIIESLAMVMAFKFGVHVATPPAGTSQIASTTTPPVPETPTAAS